LIVLSDAIVVGCDASRDVSYFLFYFGGKTGGYIFIGVNTYILPKKCKRVID